MLTLTPTGTLINASVNYVPGNPIYEAIQSLKAKLKGGLLTRPLTPNALEHALKALQATVRDEEVAAYLVGLKEIEAYLFAYEFTDSYQQALVNAAHVFGQDLPKEGRVEQKPSSPKTTLRAKKPASEEKFSSSVNVIDSKSLKPSNGYLQGFFKEALGTISQAVQYTKDNPGKVLLGGLAVQSMAVAAINPLGSRTGRELNHHGLQRSSNQLSNNSPNTLSLPTSLPVNRLGIEARLSNRKVNKVNKLSQSNKKITKRAVGVEFQINTYTDANQNTPSIAALNNGNFVAVWDSNGQDGSNWGVYGQIFSASGSKIGDEFQVNTYTVDGQEISSVAALSNGNFVVTWSSIHQDGSMQGVYGQIFTALGIPVGSEFQINTYTNYYQYFSAIAALSNGNFVVTWDSGSQEGTPYEFGIYGQVFTASGSKVGNEFQVNTYTMNDQRGSSIAALSNGNFVVTWWQNGSDRNVSGQIFTASGSKVGSEFQVNTYTDYFQYLPTVAALSNGNFVVTWQSDGQDGSNYGVYGQVFAANGIKIGNEFQVNTYTTDNQNNPSIAALSNGNFVVTWQSSQDIVLSNAR